MDVVEKQNINLKMEKKCCSKYYRSCPKIRERKHTDETKNKIKNGNKGKCKSRSTKLENNENLFCIYGCGNKAKFIFKSGKVCCEDSSNKCPINKIKNSKANKNKNKGKTSPFKGRRHSEETKKILSNINKNKKLNDNIKRKISKSLIGRKRKPFSEETKNKISKAMTKRLSKPENNPMYDIHRYGEENPFYGKKHSEESKKKMSISCKNRFKNPENHPCWRGGSSIEKYPLIFGDKKWRQYLFERDKEKTCWNPYCSGKCKKEVLHHINYNKEDCSFSNIIKVCLVCNSVANFNREYWKSIYTDLMLERGFCNENFV